MKNKFPVRKP